MVSTGSQPLAFRPTALPLRWRDRIAWPFSASARARAALARAHAASAPTAAEARRLAAWLKVVPVGGQADAESRLVAGACQEYLVWSALERAELQTAAAWIDVHSSADSDPTRLASMRWSLLRRIADRGANELFESQAVAFCADTLVSPARHRDAVREVVSALHASDGAACCARALAALGERISQDPALEAAREACAAPGEYPSEAVAAAWQSKLDPAQLAFAPTLQHAAHCARAAAAAWSSAWDTMRADATAAIALRPDDPRGHYWLCRARLHAGERAQLPRGVATADAHWTRLLALCELVERPSMPSAAVLLALCQPDVRALPKPERTLVAEAVCRALDMPPDVASTELELAPELCRQVERALGGIHAATAFASALHAARRGEHASALEQLARTPKPKQRSQRARELELVCRLLAGSFDARWLADPNPDLAALDAAWRSAFPALPVAQALLRCARSLGSAELEDADAAAFGEELTAPAACVEDLPWMSWLRARLVSTLPLRPVQPSALPVASAAALACAWDAERDRCEHFASDEDVRGACARQGEQLDAWERSFEAAPESNARNAQLRASRRRDAGSFFAQLRASRLRRAPLPEEAIGAARGEHWRDSLGPTIDALRNAELEIEAIYQVARTELAQGDPRGARRRLSDLENLVVQEPAPSRAWWLPIVRYWRAVAHANLHETDTARAHLVKLRRTHVRDLALAQLALLELACNELDAARAWLAESSRPTPAGEYARASILLRAGRGDEALGVLEELARWLASQPPTPYRAAGARLSAVAAERRGDAPGARSQYLALVAQRPDDEVTLVRLLRLELRRALGDCGEPAALDRASVVDLASRVEARRSTLARHAPWGADLVTLAQLVGGELGNPQELSKRIGRRKSGAPSLDAWHELLCGALLARGLARVACKLVPLDEPQPSWSRARSALAVWNQLVAKERAATTLAALVAVLDERAGDAELARWRRVAQLIARELAGSQPIEAAEWGALAPWPVASLAGLWSEDVSRPSGELERLRARLEHAAPGWSAEQAELARALCARVARDTDAFLASYTALEGGLDGLPVVARDLWLEAASAWFARGDWKALLDRPLPESIADLADPVVGETLGCAYARVVADAAADRNVGAAKAAIGRARAALGARTTEGA